RIDVADDRRNVNLPRHDLPKGLEHFILLHILRNEAMRAFAYRTEHDVTVAPPVHDYQSEPRVAMTQFANAPGDDGREVDSAIENQQAMRLGGRQPGQRLIGVARSRDLDVSEFAPDNGSETAPAKQLPFPNQRRQYSRQDISPTVHQRLRPAVNAG